MSAPEEDFHGGVDGVERAFQRSIGRLLADPAPLTVLFSGGVDSSLVAQALGAHPDLELLTVGTLTSTDLRHGRSAAEQLHLPWRGAVVDRAEVERVIARQRDLLPTTNATARAVAVSFAVAVAQTRPSRVVTAQGVDELFLGYAHFRGLAGPALEQRYRADLDTLLQTEWPRALRMGAREGRGLIAPFLEPELLEACTSIGLTERARGPEPKAWLRAWAERRGLPPELAHRPKKALQYGSGIGKLLSAR